MVIENVKVIFYFFYLQFQKTISYICRCKNYKQIKKNAYG